LQPLVELGLAEAGNVHFGLVDEQCVKCCHALGLPCFVNLLRDIARREEMKVEEIAVMGRRQCSTKGF